MFQFLLSKVKSLIDVFQVFMSEYLLIYQKGGWMELDFGKHGLENTSVIHQELQTRSPQLWHKEGQLSKRAGIVL